LIPVLACAPSPVSFAYRGVGPPTKTAPNWCAARSRIALVSVTEAPL